MSSNNNKRKLQISTSDYDPTKRWEKSVRTDKLYGKSKNTSASSYTSASSASNSNSTTGGGGGIRRFQQHKSSRDNTSSKKRRVPSSTTDRRRSSNSKSSSRTASTTAKRTTKTNYGGATTSKDFTNNNNVAGAATATTTATHGAFVHRKKEAAALNNSNNNNNNNNNIIKHVDDKDNNRRGSSIPNTIITKRNNSSSNNDNNSRRDGTPFLHRETVDDTNYNDNAGSPSINTIQYNRGGRRVPMKSSHFFSTTTNNNNDSNTPAADYRSSNNKRRKTNTVSSNQHHPISSSITASQKKISKADDEDKDQHQDQDYHSDSHDNYNNNNNNNDTHDGYNDEKQRYHNDKEQQEQNQMVVDGDYGNDDDDNATDAANAADAANAEFTEGDNDDDDDDENGYRLVGTAVHFDITEKENRLILKEGITSLESVKRQPLSQGKQQTTEAASSSATTTMNITTKLPGPSLVGRWSTVLVAAEKTTTKKKYNGGDGTHTNNTIDRMHLRHDSVVSYGSCPANRPLNYNDNDNDNDNDDGDDKKQNTNDLAQQQKQQSRNIVVTVLCPQKKDRYKNVNGNDDDNQELTPPMAQRRIDETPGGSLQITDAVNRIASVGFFSSSSSSSSTAEDNENSNHRHHQHCPNSSNTTVVLSPYKNSNRIDGGTGMMYFCNLPLNSDYYLLIARDENLPGNPIVGIDVVFNDERTSDSLLKLKGSDYLVANPSTKISDRITGINKDNGHDYHASSEEEFTVDDEGKGDDDDDEEEDIITPSSPLTEAKLKGQYHMNSPRKPTLKKKPSKKKNIDTIDEAMTSDSDEDEFGGVEETSVGRRGTITSVEIVGMSHVKDWRQKAASVDNRNGLSSKKSKNMHDLSSSSSSSFSVDSNDDEEEEKGTPKEPMKMRPPTPSSAATFSGDDNDEEEEYRRRYIMEQKPKVLLSQFNSVASETEKRNVVSERNGNNNNNSNSNSNSSSRYNKGIRTMTYKGNKNGSTNQRKEKLNGKQDGKSRRVPKQTLKTGNTSQRKQKLNGKQDKSRRVTLDGAEKERKSYVERRQNKIQNADDDDDDSSCWDNDFDNLSIDSIVPFDDQYENNDDDNANFIIASSDEENEIPSVPNMKKRVTVEKSIEGVVQQNKIRKSNLDSNALSSRNENNVHIEEVEGTNPTHLNAGRRLLRNAPRTNRPYFRLGVSLVCSGLVLLLPLVRDPCRFRHLELRARKKSLPPPVLFQNHLKKANSIFFPNGHGITM